MNNLYTNHSEIYEMMYQTFINYDEEYAYYSDKLKKYNAGSVIELGCGDSRKPVLTEKVEDRS